MKYINLTKNKRTVIDDEDYEYLNQFKWHFSSRYAMRKIWLKDEKRYKSIPMHRLILNNPKNLDIDHIDGDGLNNQKSNLRACTHAQNLINRPKQKNNTSGFKGVYWNKWVNKWFASIMVNQKSINLGFCSSKEEAAKIYNDAAIKYFGNYAYLNKFLE